MKLILTPKTSKLTPIKKSLQKGFTLVEILIALMIAAMMISVATIALNDNERAELKTKSRQLYGLLQVAQEESIIRGIELGVRIESDGYSFMIYNGGKWQPLEEHRLLKAIELEDPIRVAVNLEGQDALLENEPPEDEETPSRDGGKAERSDQEERKNKSNTPQIYMLSSGEMNEFVVTVGLDREEPLFYRIRGSYVGDIDFSNALEGHYSHDWDKDLDDEDDE